MGEGGQRGKQESGPLKFGAIASVLLPGGARETPGNKQQHQLTSNWGLRSLIVSHTYGPCQTNTNSPQMLLVGFGGSYDECQRAPEERGEFFVMLKASA